MASRVADKDLMCLIWRDSPTDQYLNTLTYGDGVVRTYWEDCLDPRIGEHVKVYTVKAAITKLAAGDGTKVLMPVWVAKHIGNESWVFDQP